MNNKKRGTEFEQEFCQLLADNGFWVHFMVPNAAGGQPFDVIAVKNGIAYAVDCKTCKANVFSMSRLEDNQILAFEKWMKCGNKVPIIAIKHNDEIRFANYAKLAAAGTLKICDLPPIEVLL